MGHIFWSGFEKIEKIQRRKRRGMTADGKSEGGADFPVELVDVVKDFQGSLTELERALRPLLTTTRDELQSNEQMTPLEKAKLDCLSAFAINSLAWMWMRTKGINPKDTEVKGELNRVKNTMAKMKEIQDKEKRHKVDQGAAKRLVASGLWKPGEAKKRHQDQQPSAAAAEEGAKRSKQE